MLSIKLKRIGKKHQASFRVVVSERRSKLKGDYTEDLGWYNPGLDKGEFKIDRIKYWQSVGASVSATVHNLLLKNKLYKSTPRPINIPFTIQGLLITMSHSKLESRGHYETLY